MQLQPRFQFIGFERSQCVSTILEIEEELELRVCSPKKSLNVESPSFTPNFTPKTAAAQPAKIGISPKAVAAATFTPRGSGSF